MNLPSAVAILAVSGIVSSALPAGPARAGGEPPVPTAATGEQGCYLNFVAYNGGSASIFIDIEKSRIRSVSPLYGFGPWSSITNTPSQNIQAKARRSFTVWAKLCGLTGMGHQVDFVLKKGADTKSYRAEHGGGDKTTSLGDISRLF